MRLVRCGSNSVSLLSRSSLRVRHLSGAALNDLVTVCDGAGSSFVGRVVEIGRDSCLVRVCSGEHFIRSGDLQVWLGSDELELPLEPPPVAPELRSRTIFKTGIAPVDALFPLQHGQSVFLAGVSLRESFPFVSSLVQGALADRQWPCMIALDMAGSESRTVRRMWNRFGLEGEGLFISDSRDHLYQSMTPLRLGFEAALVHASEGRDVFMVILDIESWFRFYQEDLALRGSYRSRAGALNGFRSRLCSRVQLLRGRRGRGTGAALLSERKIAGLPAELLALRDLFDGCLILRGDGALSLSGSVPQPPRGTDSSVEYARVLRRQCKDLAEKLREKRRDEYPLTPQETAFASALHDFLSDLRPREGGADEIWRILSLLPESAINRVPVSLMREHGGDAAGEIR